MSSVPRLLPAPFVAALTGCSLFAGSTAPPPAPPPTSTPVIVAPPRIDPPDSAPPPPSPVALADVQATLGRAIDDPAVRALTDSLGAPSVRDEVHAFPGHGVLLRFVDGRVAEVGLVAPGPANPGWRGPLPAGLRFGMNDYQVGRSLGVEIPLREVGRDGDARVLRPATAGGRTFRGHGVRAHFDRGALALVVLLPAPAPGSVHVDDVVAAPTTDAGAGGLRIHYHLDATAATCERLDVTVQVVTAAGQPVRARAAPRARSQPFVAIDAGAPCTDGDRSLFVPFGDLDLPAGPHALQLRFTASPPGDPHTELAAGRGQVELTMPAVAMVRLRVRRAEIQREMFRERNAVATLTFGISSLFKRPKLRPDPFWVLTIGRHHHRSKVQSATFSPRWSESSAWFPLADGDTLTLHVADDDLAGDEPLARMRLGLAELRAAVRGEPLAAGWVTRLELAGSELLEADPRR